MLLVPWDEVPRQLLHDSSGFILDLTQLFEVGPDVEGSQILPDSGGLLSTAACRVEEQELLPLHLSITVSVIGLEEAGDPVVIHRRQVSTAGLDEAGCTLLREVSICITEAVIPLAEEPTSRWSELSI